MRQTECSRCQKEIATNESFAAGGAVFCEVCAQAEGIPERQIDPTVCAGCGADWGNSPLSTLQSGLPVCDSCRVLYLNRPFPGWVKAAFLGLLALAAISFAHNWRFVQSYRDMSQGVRSVGAGDIRRGAALMQRAAERIPEIEGVAEAASFYRALLLLIDDKSTEAAVLLRAWKQRNPNSTEVDEFLERAEYGAAFERHDYDAFLDRAQAIAARRPGTIDAAGVLASAYACKFASTGQEQFRKLALKSLEDAAQRSAGKGDEVVSDLRERLQHRLETREILDRNEFRKRYPNGWTKGAGR